MKEKEDASDGQIYEIGFHILPTVPEEKLQEIVSKLEDSITKNRGSVISQEFPKMRALSYDIKERVETKYLSFSKAYFGWIKFETDPSAVGKIKDEASNNDNILRFIIIKTVKENTMQAFKPPMQMREGGREETKSFKEIPSQTPKAEISEEEIDKSIDELVINQDLNQ